MRTITILFIVFVLNPAFTFSEGQWVKYSTGSKSTDGIVSIAIENDYIWCGTSGGLVRWNRIDGSYKNFIPGNNSVDCSVTALEIDSKGTKWLGVISDIYTASPTFDWTGKNGCVYSFDNVTWKKIEKEMISAVPDNKIDFRIGTIIIDNMDRVFAEFYYDIYKNAYQQYTKHYISMYDGISWNNFFSVAYPEYRSMSIMIDSYENNILWASEWYLHKFNLSDMTKNTIEMEKRGGAFMGVDRDNNIWIGSGIQYDRKTFTYYDPSTTGVVGGVYAVAVDGRNVKWFGSHAGITRFDGIYWKTYAPEGWIVDSDLNNEGACVVFDLEFDNDGILWAGTNRGLYRFNTDFTSVHETTPQPSILINYISPNPFNASTLITFTIPASARAELVVYSVTGQRIRTLATGPMTAGTHTATWDGRDDSGRAVSSGVYISRLTSGKNAATGRMALVK